MSAQGRSTACIAALLAALLLVAGCGGSDATTGAALPTAEEVTQCFLEGGGKRGDQRPIKPEGFPAHVKASMITGPQGNHIGFYLSRRPVFTPRVARGFDEIGELKAKILLGGRALMLFLPGYISATEKHLTSECLEG